MKQHKHIVKKIDALDIVEYITVGLFFTFSLFMGIKALSANTINVLTFTICAIIGGATFTGYVILRKRIYNNNKPYLFK